MGDADIRKSKLWTIHPRLGLLTAARNPHVLNALTRPSGFALRHLSGSEHQSSCLDN